MSLTERKSLGGFDSMPADAGAFRRSSDAGIFLSNKQGTYFLNFLFVCIFTQFSCHIASVCVIGIYMMEEIDIGILNHLFYERVSWTILIALHNTSHMILLICILKSTTVIIQNL